MTEQFDNLPVPQTAEVVQAVQSLGDLLPTLEKRMEILTQFQRYIDKQVNPEVDFDKFDGTIRRNINYAKKVFRIVGGSWSWLKDDQGRPMVVRLDYEDSQGKYYVYEASGCYTLPNGESIEGTGMFSSRDKFFGRKSGEFKPVEDVDERSVRQAAQTECFKKCIFTALGYGEATEAELAKCGVNTGDTSGHDFERRKGNQGGNTDSDEQGDKRAEIKRMCVDMYNVAFQPDDADAFGKPEDVLKYLTKSKNGKFSGWDSFEKISAKGIDIGFPQIEEAYNEVMKNDF